MNFDSLEAYSYVFNLFQWCYDVCNEIFYSFFWCYLPKDMAPLHSGAIAALKWPGTFPIILLDLGKCFQFISFLLIFQRLCKGLQM